MRKRVSNSAYIAQNLCVRGQSMPPMTMEEAKRIMRQHGQEELKFVVSISAPLYWGGPLMSFGRGCQDPD
jgi:hypothetical protein